MLNYKQEVGQEWDGILDFSSNRVMTGWHPGDKTTKTYIHDNNISSCNIIDNDETSIPDNFKYLKKIEVGVTGIVRIEAPKLTTIENIPFCENLTLVNLKNVESFAPIKTSQLKQLKLIDCVQDFKKFTPFNKGTRIEVINNFNNVFKFKSLIGLKTTEQNGIVDFNKIIIHDSDFLRNTELKYTYNHIMNNLFQGQFYEEKNKWARDLYESMNPTIYEEFANLVVLIQEYENKYNISPECLSILIKLLSK